MFETNNSTVVFPVYSDEPVKACSVDIKSTNAKPHIKTVEGVKQARREAQKDVYDVMLDRRYRRENRTAAEKRAIAKRRKKK